MSMYYTYSLQSIKDSTFYIGYSADVDARLVEHNKGKNKYTKGHIPYKVVHVESFETKKAAKEREQYIKSFKNTKKYLEMIGSPDLVGTSPACPD